MYNLKNTLFLNLTKNQKASLMSFLKSFTKKHNNKSASANAFSYLSDNKAGCIDHLKEMIAQRCAKQVEVQLRLNEGGRSAANTVPDLRQLINFDIEEENF